MTQTILGHLSDQETTELARLCRVALSNHEMDGDFLPPVLVTALRNVRDWCAADLTARHDQFTRPANGTGRSQDPYQDPEGPRSSEEN